MRRGRAVLLGLLAAGAAGAGGDWPQARRDAANSACAELAAPASGAPRAWSFDGSGRVWGYEPGMTVWSSPALFEAGGRATACAGSYDRNLYCRDAASGEPLWKLTTGAPVYAAPTAWRDGERTWLYVASSDRLVYALDAATGRQRWVHAVETYRPTLGGARLSAPVTDGEAVYVGYWVWDRSLGANLSRAGVMALGARDGKPRWDRRLGDAEVTAPVAAGGRLFVGTAGGGLYALDAASGAVLWQRAELDAVRGAPAVAGDLVVAASLYGTVRGLDAATGEERWRVKTGDRVIGSPALLAGRVFVGSYDRAVYAIDPAGGAVLWRRTLPAAVYSSAALAEVGGRELVLVSAWDHALHGLAWEDGAEVFALFTGRPLWNVAGLDESAWSSPAAARVNGVWMAYAGGYDGTLRALPLETAEGARVRRSNLGFWLSFPLALGPVAALALWLTRRGRRRVTSSGRRGAPRRPAPRA